MGLTFIDLGLPSGTLWAAENAVVNGKTYFNFKEAVKTFNNELPSAEAWEELFQHCDYDWINIHWNNIHEGIKLTGPNGNTLFLPAAGEQDFNEETEKLIPLIHNVGTEGWYWSSTPYNESYANAQFFSGSVTNIIAYRPCGFSIRLCKSK